MSDLLSAEQVLLTKGVLVETTVGTSMLPLFKNRRDTVVIEPVYDRLNKYDVPLYRRGQQLVLHRIVKVRSKDYLVRGDNCENTEIISDYQIIGVMTHFCRKNKNHSVKDKSYRLYARLWVLFFPLRCIIKKVYIFTRKIFSVLWRYDG